jgi:hypothetical protein
MDMNFHQTRQSVRICGTLTVPSVVSDAHANLSSLVVFGKAGAMTSLAPPKIRVSNVR